MKGNALGYLLRTKMRNQLLSFFKKPIRIVYVVIVLGLLAMTFIGGKSGAAEPDRKLRDISELTAGINALFILIFSTTFNSGLKNGGTFFKMSDVNFLFPSPLSKRSVLFYALVQQMWSSLLIGIFILFQYSALHVNYNLSALGLILIFLTYSLVTFLSQTFAMFVYTYVSDSDKKRNIAKIIFYAVILLPISYAGLQVLQNKSAIIPALAKAGNGLPVLVFPFAGWLGGFTGGILKGEYFEAAVYLAVCAVAFFVMLTAMSRSKRDYYEDVIASAESIQSITGAAKDGVAPESAPRHIKVGRTGIGRGEGSSVLFFKHLLENRRLSKIMVSPMSIMFTLISIGFSLFIKDGGIFPVFAFSIYIMIFSVAVGRFNRELTKPYIYLIPEPPMKKMIYALAETFPTQLVESSLIFIPISVIMGIDFTLCIVCIVARVAFSAVFLSAGIAIERIWGGSLPKLAGVFLYFLVDILMVLPGAGLAYLVSLTGFQIISSDITAILCLTVSNILVSLLVLYLCRNVLQYAEVN